MFEHSCALAARSARATATSRSTSRRCISARDDFCDAPAGHAARTGLAPSRLVIEVTEGSLLDDPEGVRDILRDRCATTASARRWTISAPAIPRSATCTRSRCGSSRSTAASSPASASRHGNSEAVVGSILALARALGVRSVAEGIETEAQRDTLLAMGCRFGQGYLLGRPAPRLVASASAHAAGVARVSAAHPEPVGCGHQLAARRGSSSRPRAAYLARGEDRRQAVRRARDPLQVRVAQAAVVVDVDRAVAVELLHQQRDRRLARSFAALTASSSTFLAVFPAVDRDHVMPLPMPALNAGLSQRTSPTCRPCRR